MKRILLGLFIMMMLVPSAVCADGMGVMYKQSFESESLPAGWDAASGKSQVVSEATVEGVNAYDGDMALRVGANAAIEKSFTDKESLSGSKISVWIYDDMSNTATAVISLSGTDQIGITFGVSSVMGWNNKYYSYRFKNSGGGTRTSVERSLGWHKFTIDLSNDNKAVLSIDEEEAVSFDISGVYDKISLGAPWYGANSTNNIYIDNLVIEKEEKIKVTKSVFSRDGMALEEIAEGNIDCNVTVLNNTSKNRDCTLILAFYKEKQLVGVSLSEPALLYAWEQGSVNGSLKCMIKDDEVDCNYRLDAYMWDSISGMKPVFDSIRLTDSIVAKKYLPKSDALKTDLVYESLGISIASESLFLGYQRGINRDLAIYAGKATNAKVWSGDFESLVALSDIDGDGFDDALLKVSDSIFWMQNNADGTFKEKAVLNIAVVPEGAKVISGDFNADGYADFAYINEGKMKLYLKADGIYKELPEFNSDILSGFGATEIRTGDFDGNGYCDLIAFDASGRYLILYGNRLQKFNTYHEGRLSFIGDDVETCGLITTADFNTDGYCDVALLNSSASPDNVLFLMGKGDGGFGITADEENELWATSMYGKIPWKDISPSVFVAGNLTKKYQHPDFAVVDDGTLLVRSQTNGHIPYDYSMHLIKDDGKYRLYSGGRWITTDKSGNIIGDGDHVLLSESKDGGYSWNRYYKPMFYRGGEIGEGDKWYANNVLEPEVIKVDGTYYMFCQVQINPGWQIPEGGVAAAQCDRIVLATSNDGYNWNYEAGTTGSVIKNVDESVAAHISFHHQEVIYVEDDADGKTWWMYVCHNIDGVSKGYVRIRSDNPRYFDYADREKVGGIAQLGNQIGYLENTPVGRVFTRITFSGSTPYLQMSTDGLLWHRPSDGVLAGVDAELENATNNKNCYFLGIATENGTGRIMPEEDGTYKLVYAASTSNSAAGSAIFSSEGGIGMATLKFE